MRGNKYKWAIFTLVLIVLISGVYLLTITHKSKNDPKNVYTNYSSADQLAEKSNVSAAKFMAAEYDKAKTEKEKSSYAMRAARYFYMDGKTTEGNYWIGLAEKSFAKLKDQEGINSAEQLKSHSNATQGPDSKYKGAGNDTFQ